MAVATDVASCLVVAAAAAPQPVTLVTEPHGAAAGGARGGDNPGDIGGDESCDEGVDAGGAFSAGADEQVGTVLEVTEDLAALRPLGNCGADEGGEDVGVLMGVEPQYMVAEFVEGVVIATGEALRTQWALVLVPARGVPCRSALGTGLWGRSFACSA